MFSQGYKLDDQTCMPRCLAPKALLSYSVAPIQANLLLLFALLEPWEVKLLR